MADSVKKDKIAAAKKKLKQFQQRSGRTPSRSPAPSSRSQPTGGAKGKEDALSDNNYRRSVSPVIEQSQEYKGRGRTISRKSENVAQVSSVAAETLVDGENHLKSEQDGLRPSSKSADASSALQPSVWSSEQYRPTASTESLQQLSRQLNGLLAESADYTSIDDEPGHSTLEDLETRNRELAALLEKHSQANEHLNTQNLQLACELVVDYGYSLYVKSCVQREHARSLQGELEKEKSQFSDKYRKDVGSLKEQLQVHIQTIGILVAEKTELQSQVGQSQRIADQRLEEIEELSGRLKASRQRVADLERSLSTSSQTGQQLEKSNKENTKEIDRLKLELYKASKSCDERQQQISELTEKLRTKASEAAALEQNVEDLKRKLEMAEIYAHQLSSENESSEGNMKMLTDLQTQRDSLMVKLKQHEETIQALRQEREQVRDHYQQQADGLTQQIQHLTQQVSSLSEDREKFVFSHHQLEATVHELRQQLESARQSSSVVEKTKDHTAQQHLIEQLEQLRVDLHELHQRHEAQIRDNAQLSRFLEERENKVLELEQQVEQMGSQVEDRTSLLESVQSDKTALSRALSQNKELKAQLAELQNGFVKMSNDNMELVTRLQASEHSANDLAARLAQQEDELKNLREGLSSREVEVVSLREAGQMAARQQYQQDQIQDRLRHYEAQAHLVDTLQNELTAAQDMMEALTTQNSELRAMLIKATEIKHKPGENDNGKTQTNDLIESLNATIRQLEQERGQLYESLKEQRHLSDNLSVKVADLQEEVIRKATDYVDSDKISRSEYEQLKTSMEMIQEKYTRVMRDKAELTDKADQLEHLVVQLQGETDTIGEYISLYHHQRALLQQRELQKNDYIAQLARDREQLQDKLGELQALVMQLLGERNMLHSYHEESATQNTHNGHGHSHSHGHVRPHKSHVIDPAIQPHLTATMNGSVEGYNDWPDYTSSDSDVDSEVEPIVGGADYLPSSSVDTSSSASQLTDTTTADSSFPKAGASHSHVHTHGHHPHHRHRTHSQSSRSLSVAEGGVAEDDQTAHRILNLLSEIGHSNLVAKLSFTERNFLPCKYCKGAVQII